MSPKLSILSHYYNHHDRVREQIAYWETLPDTFLSQVEFILVDDCSERPAEFRPTKLNLKVFRITTDIPWNQAGARNLCAFTAVSPWGLYFDMDQRFFLEPLVKLLPALDRFNAMTMFYLRGRNIMDEHGAPMPIHVNTILVNLPNFRIYGMYDEDFAGHYGYEDLYLPLVWERRGGNRLVLSEIDYFEDLKFGTTGLNRDLSRNKLLGENKLRAGCKNSTSILRFEWEPVIIEHI